MSEDLITSLQMKSNKGRRYRMIKLKKIYENLGNEERLSKQVKEKYVEVEQLIEIKAQFKLALDVLLRTI